MSNRLSRISFKSTAVRSVGVYAFSNFLTKAVSFASLPFFTYALDKSDFGVVSIFSTAVNFLLPFVALGVLYSTSTDFFKSEKPEFASFIRTTSPIPVIMSFLAMLVFIAFFPFFQRIGFSDSFVYLVPLVAYCNFLFEQNITLLRNYNLTKTYLAVTVTKMVLELAIAVSLVWMLHLGWAGRVAGIAGAFVVTGLFAWSFIIRNGLFDGKFSRAIIRQELLFSLPALATQFSIIFLNSADRFFINSQLGSERTGVYSLAATFASIIFIFNSALLQYVFPRLFASFAKSEFGAPVRSVFVKYLATVFAAAAGLLVFTWVCYHYFLNPAFIGGLRFFYVLLGGYLIWAVTYFFYSIQLYFKQKGRMTILAVVTVSVSAMVMYYAVSNYQEAGATWAVLFSYCFMLVFTLLINRNRIREIFQV